MAKLSLNSLPKNIRLYIRAVSLACAIFLSINILLSVIINEKFSRAEKSIARSEEYFLRHKFIYFNLFKGLTIKGLELSKDNNNFFSSGGIDLGFDILSFLQFKIRVKNIRISDSYVSLNKISAVAPLLNKIISSFDGHIGFLDTAYFIVDDLRVGGLVQLDANGYFSFIKGVHFISRGDVSLKSVRNKIFPGKDFFKGSNFYKPFNYIFEAEKHGQDFSISRLELSNSFLKFSGIGQVNDFTSDNAQVLFEMKSSGILFEDFPVLRNLRIQSKGTVYPVLKILGPVSNLKSLLTIGIKDVDFVFSDSFSLRKINGSAVFSGNHLVGQDVGLFVNDMPFKADFAVFKDSYPRLLLTLHSSSKVSAQEAFVLNASSTVIDGALYGNIKAVLKYISKNTVSTMDFNLRDLCLKFLNRIVFDVKDFFAVLSVRPVEVNPVAKIFNSSLNAQDVSCAVTRKENGLALNILGARCYGGVLDGNFDFIPVDGKLSVKGEAHLRDVVLGDFFDKSKGSLYSLSGNLNSDLRLDTALKDMFKGQLFITKGVIEQNPILSGVSDFLGVPSLKKIEFDDLSMFFEGGCGDYASNIKLQSEKVSGFLEGKIISYDNMDGYLSINISTKLLSESKQFKKILTYIRHDEPFVSFPFKISSYIDSPRVLWLKNEFNEKLGNLLPERNKRSLQQQINKMIEEVESRKQ